MAAAVIGPPKLDDGSQPEAESSLTMSASQREQSSKVGSRVHGPGQEAVVGSQHQRQPAAMVTCPHPQTFVC